jgi:DDE superfamily endonuclease
MRAEGRHVLLVIDNFSGHFINYQPSNTQIELFKPNLTSFIQPLDAGIIRCFKAHYRSRLCQRAIDLDEAGEAEIYKINLLEGIMTANAAWKAVTAETVKHCWDHTRIQPCVIVTSLFQLCLDLIS